MIRVGIKRPHSPVLRTHFNAHSQYLHRGLQNTQIIPAPIFTIFLRRRIKNVPLIQEGGTAHGRSRKRGQSWELLGSRTTHKSASKCWCIVEWASGIYKVISRTLPVEQRSVGKGVSDLEKNLGVLSLHAARISPNPSPGGCHATSAPSLGELHFVHNVHWCTPIFKYKPEKHSTSSFWEMPLKEGTNYPDLLC